MNLEAMLEPADSSVNVTKIQPPYWVNTMLSIGKFLSLILVLYEQCSFNGVIIFRIDKLPNKNVKHPAGIEGVFF